MRRKLYFMIDKAYSTKKRILKKEVPPSNLYGGYNLEKQGKAKIIEPHLEEIKKIKRGSVVFINRSKYIPLLKLFGMKIVHITINSNHDLSQNRKTLKGILLHTLYKIYYNLCDLIVCTSEIQTKKLREIGVKNLVVIPTGIEKSWLKRKLSRKFYLSAGADKGRNYEFIYRVLRGYKSKILEGTPLPYHKYINILAKTKAVVLNIDTSRKDSSDLSGVTTASEALLMNKPVLINYQPWLKELFKENYYTYKNEKDLKKLLKKDLKFKKFNYDFLTLKHFTSKLMENIEKL